jgi:type VI secretion system secreted protein Hcp
VETRKAKKLMVMLFLCGMLVLALTAAGGRPMRGAPPSSDALPDYSQPAGAAPIHMEIVRETTGNPIIGSCKAPDRPPDSIAVVGYAHDIYRPHDPLYGVPTEERQHTPLTIVKYIDRATPDLYEVLCEGELLTEVKLTFWRTNPKNAEELYYQITLTNAYIVDIKASYPNLETISFTYQTITWELIPESIIKVDTWQHIIEG